MTQPPPDEATRIGHLLGPHGVQGGIKLYVLGDPEQLRSLKRVFIEQKGWLRLHKTEPLAPGLVLHLAGVNSRETAETLRGLNVYAADNELPALEEGSYYYHDLRGLNVLDADGIILGVIEDVEDVGYQDLLVVRHDAGTSFVPLQAPYVQVKVQGHKPVQVALTPDAPAGLIGAEPPEPEED